MIQLNPRKTEQLVNALNSGPSFKKTAAVIFIALLIFGSVHTGLFHIEKSFCVHPKLGRALSVMTYTKECKAYYSGIKTINNQRQKTDQQSLNLFEQWQLFNSMKEEGLL